MQKQIGVVRDVRLMAFDAGWPAINFGLTGRTLHVAGAENLSSTVKRGRQTEFAQIAKSQNVLDIIKK